MKNAKTLARPAPRRRAKTLEETRKELVRSRYRRYNFMLTRAEHDLLDELVEQVRNQTGLEMSKSGLVRVAIRKLRGKDIREILLSNGEQRSPHTRKKG